MLDKDNIKVKGHKGTWYAIGETTKNGKKYFLLEHNTYGEDACHVAIDEDGNLVLEDFYGMDYLSEHLDLMDTK